MGGTPTRADQWLKIFQTISIVAGILGSVWNYTASLDRTEKTRRIVASQPFLKLRQERYEEVSRVVAKLSTSPRESEAYKQAFQRFQELYVVELSMVESKAVESAMVGFAKALNAPCAQSEDISHFGPVKLAAFQLAHELRDSLCSDFGLEVPPVSEERRVDLKDDAGSGTGGKM